MKTLAEIAKLVDGIIDEAHAALAINSVTNIEEAGPEEITFAVAPHLEKAAASRAGAVLVAKDVDADFPKAVVRVDNPRAAFAILLELFSPSPAVERGVHPSAVVAENVVLGDNVAIMPCAVIDSGASIGANTIVYPHSYVGVGSSVGSDCILYPNVTVREGCELGDRVIVHSGAVIGSDGFGFVTVDGRHRKVPQVGGVRIEDDVEIGANTCLDRATTGWTVVRQGTKIDNLVHFGHNVEVGEHCFFVAQTGIAGSTKIGSRVTFAGQSGSAGHLTIGDNCVFAARSAPIGNIASNSFCGGFPARPYKEWLKNEAAVTKVPELLKRVRELEKQLAQLTIGESKA
ncbi:UDP-3-O-(3-hydroxymyristoyl)glucosamine N-acyltransferase [Anaeroarcus burkinensis]|uniref:UDP-3-O-(3-hydroxymyristoyl)glucosamine N-acyltransferase n=1 Tax=Anaeroarcus burkinensis TaxID=82376 RepID=UPI00041FB4B4|nr:UDP-3-O-(3-hydroxymyristoyl)glucosamine N-acyltransferase [Anaeroarcus burkinensis]